MTFVESTCDGRIVGAETVTWSMIKSKSTVVSINGCVLRIVVSDSRRWMMHESIVNNHSCRSDYRQDCKIKWNYVKLRKNESSRQVILLAIYHHCCCEHCTSTLSSLTRKPFPVDPLDCTITGSLRQNYIDAVSYSLVRILLFRTLNAPFKAHDVTSAYRETATTRNRNVYAVIKDYSFSQSVSQSTRRTSQSERRTLQLQRQR